MIHKPLRDAAAVDALQTTRAGELAYVGEAIQRVVAHFKGRLGMIGFCGAPFTLASYMIEGGGSRNYIETKKLMYRQPDAWRKLAGQALHCAARICGAAGGRGRGRHSDFRQLGRRARRSDYRDFVLPATRTLVREVQALGVPVIYFGVDTASLLPAMRETGADVLGLDWRTPLDQAWREPRLRLRGAGQSRSHHAVCGAGADPHACASDSRAGRRPARAHF